MKVIAGIDFDASSLEVARALIVTWWTAPHRE